MHYQDILEDFTFAGGRKIKVVIYASDIILVGIIMEMQFVENDNIEVHRLQSNNLNIENIDLICL